MDQENQGLFDLHVDQRSIGFLREGARWARFIAIIGFIFCGLMVIAAFFIGTVISTMMSSMGGTMSGIGNGFITFFYLVLAAIWFFPCLFLYRYGTKMQEAIKHNQQEKLNYSLESLKSYFKYIGVLFVLGLAVNALAIIGTLIASLAMR